jgi:hypothetical protein
MGSRSAESGWSESLAIPSGKAAMGARPGVRESEESAKMGSGAHVCMQHHILLAIISSGLSDDIPDTTQ